MKTTAIDKPAKKSVTIDAEIAPLFDYMLKKANLQFNEVNAIFIKVWISQNLDLLTESEKKRFNVY